MTGAPVSKEMLTHLRSDAVEAWMHAMELMLTSATHGQVEVAFKGAVTAQANYAIACHKKLMDDEAKR